MKIAFAETVLAVFLGAAVVHATQPMIIQNSDGKEVIVDADNKILASQSVIIKPLGLAEGVVFPANAPKRKKYRPAEKIFTGVYSSRKTVQKDSGKKHGAKSFVEFDEDLEAVSEKNEDKPTIAWITKESDFFHDPYLVECASQGSQIWVKELEALNGLEPCPKCFHQTGHAPNFIVKESGGLDLATAGALLDNPGFLVWVEQNLPIKKAIFLTSRKLLIYPKMEMTREGLQELAHETAMAYRRHTWKVIEVLGKKNEADLENISSF